MKPRPILAIALAAMFASGSALAQSPATIKANIERLTGGKVKVDQIQATPAPGIYQVISDGEVFYTDASGRFGIIGGTMLDMQTRHPIQINRLRLLVSNSGSQGGYELRHRRGGRR